MYAIHLPTAQRFQILRWTDDPEQNETVLQQTLNTDQFTQIPHGSALTMWLPRSTDGEPNARAYQVSRAYLPPELAMRHNGDALLTGQTIPGGATGLTLEEVRALAHGPLRAFPFTGIPAQTRR